MGLVSAQVLSSAALSIQRITPLALVVDRALIAVKPDAVI